ncbi:MAG: response regulator transcription factor [Zetaproteobacteria bacterium]|nr:response regulator transcription factor [Zetaproteobacteria bacterium]
MTKPVARILVAEDEQNLAFNLDLNLRAEGYQVVLATNGHQALEIFSAQGDFQVVVLDVMMPYLDGFAVAENIRRTNQTVGILMLTARAADEDRIRGFELGVDDYLTKPFHLGEMLLRIKRMVERSWLIVDPVLECGEIQHGPFLLDSQRLLLHSPAGHRQLTALEVEVFKEFFAHPGKVLSRAYLLEKVWGVSAQVETRTVDNFMVRIRKHIEPDPSSPVYLKSVRGKGYVFEVPHRS